MDIRKNITVTQMEDYELEALVHKHFEFKDYSFAADIEAKNDSTNAFEVNHDLTEYEQDMLTTHCETGEYSGLAQTLLKQLCKLGVMEQGICLIRVSH